jgi:hypothetical protein
MELVALYVVIAINVARRRWNCLDRIRLHARISAPRVELPKEGNVYGSRCRSEGETPQERHGFNSEKRSVKINEKDLGKEAAYVNYNNYE